MSGRLLGELAKRRELDKADRFSPIMAINIFVKHLCKIDSKRKIGILKNFRKGDGNGTKAWRRQNVKLETRQYSNFSILTIFDKNFSYTHMTESNRIEGIKKEISLNEKKKIDKSRFTSSFSFFVQLFNNSQGSVEISAHPRATFALNPNPLQILWQKWSTMARSYLSPTAYLASRPRIYSVDR